MQLKKKMELKRIVCIDSQFVLPNVSNIFLVTRENFVYLDTIELSEGVKEAQSTQLKKNY